MEAYEEVKPLCWHASNSEFERQNMVACTNALSVFSLESVGVMTGFSVTAVFSIDASAYAGYAH